MLRFTRILLGFLARTLMIIRILVKGYFTSKGLLYKGYFVGPTARAPSPPLSMLVVVMNCRLHKQAFLSLGSLQPPASHLSTLEVGGAGGTFVVLGLKS